MVPDDHDTTGPAQAFSILWNRKGLIIAIVACSVVVAVLALRLIAPTYTAEALVALNTRTSTSDQMLSTRPTLNSPPLTPVLVSTESDILRSRGLAAQVVEALALTRDPEFNPDLGPSTLPAPLADAWESVKEVLRGPRPDDPMERTVDRVLKALEVDSDQESYAITVAFTAKDPKKAALIANAFADLYIHSQRQSKLAEMQVATDWISSQIASLRSNLADDAAAMVAFRREQGLAPLQMRENGVVAGQQLVALTDQLAEAERERAEAESALSQARDAVKSGNLMSLTFIDQSSFLQEMRREEAKILGRIAEMSVGYRSDSPTLRAMQRQLGTLRAQMNREISRQVDRLANEAAQAKAREDALRARVDSITSGNAASDRAMTELEQREKDIEAKNLMLESFLARYAELTNRARIEEPDARIASRATPPAKPANPKPVLLLGVALAGSMGMGVSLAFLLERFRSGFRSTRHIREALDLPTLGIIPDLSRLSGGTGRSPRLPGDYLMDRPESVYAEAVRSAQIGILNARKDGAKGGVMITSSLPGEGKTAFVVSLGRSLALAGRKVLVVDCDLRRPAVARHLDSYDSPGLSEFLNQQASLEEILRNDPRSGLQFVAAGARTQDPQRLLDDPAARRMFQQVLDRYDVVLVDTPPTMVAFDAALLADVCDLALYVVAWDSTPRRAVEAGIEHLDSFHIPVGGVVLTKVDLDRQRQYSDYVDFCFRSSDYYGN